MKRQPYTYGLQNDSAPRYFRSLDELAGSPEFTESLAREFPEGASEMASDDDEGGWSRRNFLSLMGASLGLAGLAGCRRPEEKILPYAKAPEEVIPGRPQYYATALPWAGSALGLVVEAHEGRPTKIEGNSLHPDSLGAAGAFAQATVLDLYDPDRSAGPTSKGAAKTWEEALGALKGRVEALRSKSGKGLAVLTAEHRSPTTAAMLAQLKAALPETKIVCWEPLSNAGVRDGNKLAFGKRFDTVLDTAKAKVILALDADILWGDGRTHRQARGFADGRRLTGEGGREMNRLYSVESNFTITGASADHRLRLASKDVGAFTYALAAELSKAGIIGPELAGAAAGKKQLSGAAAKWIAAVAKDLAANKGACLVTAGARQPAEVHAAVALLNYALGNVGTTVSYVKTFDETPEGPQAVVDLAGEMRAGGIDTLVILDGNPVLDAPADANFADALAKVGASFHLAPFLNETSALATWHLNRAHYLESWGDVRAVDGTRSVIQPLVSPLHGGKTDAEVIEAALGGTRKDHDLVKATWTAEGGDVLGIGWRRALHDGMFATSAFVAEALTATPDAAAAAIKAAAEVAGEYEVTFAPDSHAWDGRFANNGWLAEMPDPMTKLTWDNAALLSPAAGKKLGLKDGDLVDITVDGKTVKLPVMMAPGQADTSIALTVGLGRTVGGRITKDFGFNTYGLRSSKGQGFAAATIAAAGGTHVLARTQEHHVMEGRELVREASLTRFVKEPEFAKKVNGEPEPKLFSLMPERKYEGHKWGMVIDLNTCIGCNGCMVSCQSENNIPLVGKQGVVKSREMHWIRIDRYYSYDEKAPGLTHEVEDLVGDVTAVMQPLACQQCEDAPCEQVCPVGATTHSPEGLNDMAYNRCIGTRYCANNCPYKVRRFNFFNYAKDFPGVTGAFDRPDIQEIRKMQFNPDVTVRSRGVMEKCTYCVQRINEVKIAAHREGRERVRDGEIVVACQQGCPTNAITFGDLNDPKSAVAEAAKSSRNYELLADLNIKPRTSYLARVRNLNPELG